MGRPRDTAIDRAIIMATLELLEEVGRHRLSRDQIARRARVSLPAVNRRFGSVDEIMLTIVRTPLHAESPLPVADDLRSHLVSLLERAVATVQRVPVRRPTAEILAAAAGDAEIARAFTETVEDVQAETIQRLAEARDRGELRAGTDPRRLLDLMYGALYYRLLWRGEALTEAEVASVVDELLHGVSPR